MRHVAALIACLAVTGCAGPRGEHYTVAIDPAMAEETPVILAALDDWSGNTAVTFTTVIAACPGLKDGLICIVRDDGGVTARGVTAGGLRTLAYTHVDSAIDGGIVHLDLSHPTWPMQTIAAHEIGHAMGLQHTGPGAIMSVDLPHASLTVTSEDAAQWRSLR